VGGRLRLRRAGMVNGVCGMGWMRGVGARVVGEARTDARAGGCRWRRARAARCLASVCQLVGRPERQAIGAQQRRN
jgi:hypothetical protein